MKKIEELEARADKADYWETQYAMRAVSRDQERCSDEDLRRFEDEWEDE